MPAGKRRKTNAPESVPGLGDPDRKRVLNVLAQRRYRQRRREKIEALEANAKSLTPPESFSENQNGVAQLGSSDSLISSLDKSTEEPAMVEEVMRMSNDAVFPTLEFDQNSLDFQLFPNFDITTLPTPIPSIPSTPNLLAQSTSNPSPPTFNFPLTPDAAQLTIPILSALRAFSTIATTLNVASEIYNPFYLHTVSSTPNPSLPPNLHPTPAQIAIPHHPLLDTLPWPSVREKLICMFALPSALRPPIARNEDEEGGEGQGKAIVQIVHDLDDFQDGCRVHGNQAGWGEGSELVEEAWEVGEKFYRNWWWCMDSRVLEMTNRRRRERGLGRLRLEAGTV
ncbi:hypothetical protein K469DRAFT_618495 [Zopfia rhizophila CBS 207.26]|uniref:BZIP domain-containing protein n=1 Tax=Zopfia rhizophila CBS 207.26 TaxID=1314779 RepID=A0A6A6ERP6_9PEZI|nr:hypothetical protein K469DRAFT_618495 [Zopfia rhizophila CBS 207.26]